MWFVRSLLFFIIVLLMTFFFIFFLLYLEMIEFQYVVYNV